MATTSSEKTPFTPGTHEQAVNKFYGVGVERYGDYHDGYLNFGLWEPGITNYLQASENLIRTLGKGLGLKQDSLLLDVASGMGTQDVFLTKEFGCQIESIDVTEKHVECAKRKVAQAGLEEKVRPQYGSAVAVPFPDNYFTHALCVEGAEHFDTRLKFLEEASRTLKPGGKIALADYILTHFPKKWWERLLVGVTAKIWNVPKANYETVETYKQRLEQVGFRVLEHRLVGAETIPGYYEEAWRPENVKQMRKIRGIKATYLAWLVDLGVLKTYTTGLVEYLMIWAEKK